MTQRMSNILIVEDDYDLVETYTDLLEADGYRVTCAMTVVEAFDMILQEGPDLVILDLNLPDAHGYNVIDSMRKANQMPNAIIIVVTGHPEMTSVTDQADLVLTKPVSNQQLLTIIKRYLVQKSRMLSIRSQTGPLTLYGTSE